MTARMQAERRVTACMLLALALGIAISTLAHHRFPWLLSVPPLEGVPRSGLGEMLVADLLVIGLSTLCFAHAWARHGPYLATAFLVGSFVFTGVEESMWILLGRFAPAVGGAVPGGTYWFTRGFFWFLETPVTACIGWFTLAYATMWAAELVLASATTLRRAAVAGLTAVDLDLWIDPLQTHPAHGSWVWAEQPGGIWLLSIPSTNFIGWFLLIFMFALVFARLPDWAKRQGTKRATLRFFGTLLVLEVAIFLFFTVYGALEQALVRPKLNLTVWGI